MSPGRADPAVVRRHLRVLHAAAVSLRRHQGRELDVLADDDERWAVERGLQLCAQNALDVATHIVAESGHDADDYRAAIDRLAELGVLPRGFAATFRQVAGFRNVLVHGYLELDRARLREFLDTRLDDFGEFARHVEAWLSSKTAR